MHSRTIRIVFLCALASNAAPSEELHDLSFIQQADGNQYPFYYPEDTSFLTTTPNGSAAFAPMDDNETVAFGKSYLVQKLGLKDEEIEVTSTNKGKDGVVHIYASHLINGKKVINHDAAVHVLNGQVVAESASFSRRSRSFKDAKIAKRSVEVSLEDAIKIAADKYGLPQDDFPATERYLEIQGGKIVYVHTFQLRDDEKEQWLQVSVDAQNGQIVQTVNYYNHFTYRALPIPKKNPLDGFEWVKDPENAVASPNGWVAQNDTGLSTRGNNLESVIRGETVPVNADGTFGLEWIKVDEPTTPNNENAAVVNNFYLSNTMHDIFYQYGFDEASGNFQLDNFGKGGKGGDHVIVNNHADGYQNDASFATAADGQRPVMNMYLWDQTVPWRDGSLENGIPIHEYGHGVSTRLTGGAATALCLYTWQSLGLGEGWSDAFAFIMTLKGNDTRHTDYAIADYAWNNSTGIRRFPYSTSMDRNPLTYNSILPLREPHAIGTVWATALYDLYWNLVDKYGYSSNLLDATQKKGNIMALQLIMAGLKRQPCQPTFLTARDAILSADVTFYGGETKCLIWQAFAKRGMGVDVDRIAKKDGFTLPVECGGEPVVITDIPINGTCAHDKCVVGVALDPNCDLCVRNVIEVDPFCGSNSWDRICVFEVSKACKFLCPPPTNSTVSISSSSATATNSAVTSITTDVSSSEITPFTFTTTTSETTTTTTETTPVTTTITTSTSTTSITTNSSAESTTTTPCTESTTVEATDTISSTTTSPEANYQAPSTTENPDEPEPTDTISSTTTSPEATYQDPSTTDSKPTETPDVPGVPGPIVTSGAKGVFSIRSFLVAALFMS